MLFGNGDIEIAIRELFGKLHHSGTLAHRRSNPDQPLVLRRHVAQPLAEDLSIGRPAARFGWFQPAGRIKRADAVIADRLLLSPLVTLALAGDDVQQPWPVQRPQIAQRLQSAPVNRGRPPARST